MLKWDWYKKRRNINLPRYMKFREIETYESLVADLAERNVEPPSEEEFKLAKTELNPPKKQVKKKTPVKKPEPIKDVKKPAPPSKPKRKYTRKKKA